MLTCPSKKLLHIDCPGCGLQRSFVALLKGEFVQSFQIYPATVPMLFMFGYLTGHLIFKFNNGARNLTFLFLFCSGIIFINYIYKVATNQLF